MDYKYQGIILGKKDLAETDRIYTIYTKEVGKIRITAKGVRKSNAKLAGNLEPVIFAEIFVSRGQGSGKITGVIPVENFSNIKSDWELSNRVLRTFRIIQRIISEEERDEVFFQLLLEYLQTMEKLAEKEESKRAMKAEITTLGFLVKFLDQMGYRIEVQRCVECLKKLEPKGNFFSASRGGIICSPCSTQEQRRVPVNAESIKIIRLFLSNQLKNFLKLQVSQKELNNVKIIVQDSLNWLTK